MRSVAITLLLAIAPGCNDATPVPRAEARTAPRKDPAAARKLIEAGATVLDVRTPDEYQDQHLPQATNIPLADVGARLAEVERLVGGDRSRPIVVYCASGNRSGKAKLQLEAAGFTRIINGGGLDDLE